jgi:alkanesulfonate monooxygenase SsuD/methylene tetrahydromethanopterin reductase-like flavin-dependent oxidoreductase (luciferase family)
MWQDPDFVANIRAKRQASGQDPEFRAKISASTKATWATSEHREKMKRRDERLKKNEAFRGMRKELATKQFSDPEARRKTSAASLAQWQDEGARKRVLEAQAKGRIEKNFGQTMRDIVKAQWREISLS